jgi:threonyl-tRNA synthetase
MLVLGEQEQAAEKVAVRHRTDGDKGQMPLNEFIQRCLEEIASRGTSPAVSTSQAAG